jgi:hypothetical protein
MGKRIKRVFSNADQVIHLWANQSQSDARCRNAYFEGESVFSYGSHYELGRFIMYRGVRVAMINSKGYSMTTQGHINSAYSATRHLPHLKTTGSLMDVRGALVEQQGKLLDILFDHFSGLKFRVGSKWDRESDYGDESWVKEFNSLCVTLKHPELALDLNETFIGLYDSHIQLRLERDAQLNTPEAIALRDAKAAKRHAGAIEKWRAGGTLTKELRNLPRQLIRVNGDTVQTSGGAEVPLSHALRLLKMVDRGTAKAGEPVGSFTLLAIQGDNVKIGCHTIAISEARAVLTPATLPKAA